ncbi:hypothetical protein MAR_007966 [Mya arenaria]|uniref:Uncharacterized protein n=1 Tax=Mya arenaria TaxID=6604 RepID=A0ABY7DUJ6_MYAAR|nr:hypothetical protein MAR_007966 [Mya arenaria]
MYSRLKGNSLKNKKTNYDESKNVPFGFPSTSSPLAGTLNTVVQREYQTLPQLSGMCKRGQYSSYSPDMKNSMARYAIESGNSKAAKHFSAKQGRSVNESTIRSFKSSYLLRKKTEGVDQVMELPVGKRGRPTILPRALEYKVHNAGGEVNTSIVLGIGLGVVKTQDKYLLKQNDGSIELCRIWARSLMERLHFAKRDNGSVALE